MKVIACKWEEIVAKPVHEIEQIKGRVKDLITQKEVNAAADNLASSLGVPWNDNEK